VIKGPELRGLFFDDGKEVYSQMRKIPKSKTSLGFTLIELMVVVAIIGILAAIAIPQYSQYRVRSFNATAQSDLRNIMTAEEGYYAQEQTYVNLPATEGYLPSIPSLTGARISLNVCARVTSATILDFTAEAQHKNGDTTLQSTQSGSPSTSTKAISTYDLGC
jgi:type IV pilus assembly protein PilA